MPRSGPPRGIASAIAEFAVSARWTEIPPAVRERARIHVLDSLGLALAGSVSPIAKIVRSWLEDEGVAGRGGAVFGSRLRAPPRFAAFANAAAVHADNHDDTTPQTDPGRTGGIHASAAILPTALAAGEAAGRSGAEALTAYLVGVETASRLNHAMAPRHYADGFHATGTLNAFGAAAAAARLAGLDSAGVAQALGIAASRAAGVRRNFGTMTEILHPAWAAEDGIAAAELARRGVTAAADALDGPDGFVAAAAGGADPDAVVGRLGAPWAFEDPGVWIKPHPSGALTHPAASCLLDLMEDGNLHAGGIAAIRVRTNRRVVDTLRAEIPENAVEARFSMRFVLAVIAVTGRVGPEEFVDVVVRRNDVRAMMARVEHAAFEREEPGFTNVTTFVTVETTDGRRLAKRADHARGSAARPFGLAEVRARFRDRARRADHPADKVAAAAKLAESLDRQPGVAGLCAALSR